jgi:hypothetical protein
MARPARRRLPRPVWYWCEGSALPREGEEIERNGNLSLIRDSDTGAESWVSPFEIEEG